MRLKINRSIALVIMYCKMSDLEQQIVNFGLWFASNLYITVAFHNDFMVHCDVYVHSRCALANSWNTSQSTVCQCIGFVVHHDLSQLLRLCSII